MCVNSDGGPGVGRVVLNLTMKPKSGLRIGQQLDEG